VTTTPLQAPAAWPELRLWLLDLRAEPEADAWSACDPEERDRATRFKFELHARRYRAAHAAMRQTLASHLGVAPAQWRWSPGHHGKPHPVFRGWGAFNLSHTEDWGLLAWHPRLPVGADIEWRKPLPDLDLISRRQYTEDEQAWLAAACGEPERAHRFYRLWAAKEAVLKALGSGLLVAAQRFAVPLAAEADAPAGLPVAVDVALGLADGRAPGSRCRLDLLEVALPPGLNACAAVALVSAQDTDVCW
jgi:4'-phosphopantetheinyl transferase